MFLEHTLIIKDGRESHLQRTFQFLVDPTCKIEKFKSKKTFDVNISESFSSKDF